MDADAVLIDVVDAVPHLPQSLGKNVHYTLKISVFYQIFFGRSIMTSFITGSSR